MTACTAGRSPTTAASSTRCLASPALFMLFAMANSGLPGTSGFVGEFFVILGAMQSNFWIALIAAERR